jgi:hypothetical protein
MPNHVIANWNAPANISALTTTRNTGVSRDPYAHNNMGLHVGDNEEHVQQNRASLVERLNLPNPPRWLNQTHSTRCVVVDEDDSIDADAAISRNPMQPLAIMTADCLPIVLCNTQGSEIAAIHAGWRGLLNGIIDNTINTMQSDACDLMAWIGPAMCGRCYETGSEVRDAFLTRYPFTIDAFHTRESHLYANLAQMADSIMQTLGLTTVHHSNICTFERSDEFYSYRRSAQTGRMVTLIWFNQFKKQD